MVYNVKQPTSLCVRVCVYTWDISTLLGKGCSGLSFPLAINMALSLAAMAAAASTPPCAGGTGPEDAGEPAPGGTAGPGGTPAAVLLADTFPMIPCSRSALDLG